MLLPYNVERPARLTPTVTYALIAINVLVYVLSIGYSNFKMYAERDEQAKTFSSLQSRFDEDPVKGKLGAGPDGAAASKGVPPGVDGASGAGAPPSTTGAGGNAEGAANGEAANGVGEEGPSLQDAALAEARAFKVPPEMRRDLRRTPEGRRALWNLDHAGDKLTLDAHPSVDEALGYQPSSPSILTMISALFLHPDLQIIKGLKLIAINILFLWVFGRAVEDTLGRGLFLAAYFVCGIAATLLYHVMVMSFAPAQASVPFLSAGGAIAGVLGLFAPRFYRTPVRMFYTTATGGRIFYMGTPIIGFVVNYFLGLGAAGVTLTAVVLLGVILVLGDQDWWSEKKVAAVWMIAAWVGLRDALPGVLSTFNGSGAGIEHWANIGGFLCGASYALLIGSHKEGKTEYLVDEARESLDKKAGGSAIEAAQQVVMMKPDDPVGYQLLAEAFDRKSNVEEALKNYKLALDKYLRKGERSTAAKLYQDAIAKHVDWVPEAPTLFALASQMAKDEDWKGAAENLAKLPYYYPDASEGEMAFLRASQMYIEKLDQPLVAMQLLHEFGSRFPDSQWMPKATAMYEAANQKHTGAAAR